MMDKRTKKRIIALTERLQNRRQQLIGAEKQPDDPEEPARLRKEIEAIEAELRTLQQNDRP